MPDIPINEVSTMDLWRAWLLGTALVEKTAAGDDAFVTSVAGDTDPRFVINADGSMEWGDGSGATDTDLYRSAADTLKTDDSVVVDANLTVNGDSRLGSATTDAVGFHDKAATTQRANAAQAAVATTAATNSSPYGYAQAQADAIVALLNEIRTVLVNKGLMKGAA